MIRGGWARVTDRLPSFLAGASAGLLVGWILSRSGSSGEPPLLEADGERPAAATPRRAGARDGALDKLATAAGRMRGSREALDLDALRAKIRAMPEGQDVEVRDLRGGIVEVLGHAQHAEAVRRILDALAGAPGVSVVVNRLWEPSSPAPSTHGSSA